jgi:hypothetical protein
MQLKVMQGIVIGEIKYIYISKWCYIKRKNVKNNALGIQTLKCVWFEGRKITKAN